MSYNAKHAAPRGRWIDRHPYPVTRRMALVAFPVAVALLVATYGFGAGIRIDHYAGTSGVSVGTDSAYCSAEHPNGYGFPWLQLTCEHAS